MEIGLSDETVNGWWWYQIGSPIEWINGSDFGLLKQKQKQEKYYHRVNIPFHYLLFWPNGDWIVCVTVWWYQIGSPIEWINESDFGKLKQRQKQEKYYLRVNIPIYYLLLCKDGFDWVMSVIGQGDDANELAAQCWVNRWKAISHKDKDKKQEKMGENSCKSADVCRGRRSEGNWQTKEGEEEETDRTCWESTTGKRTRKGGGTQSSSSVGDTASLISVSLCHSQCRTVG